MSYVPSDVVTVRVDDCAAARDVSRVVAASPAPAMTN